VLPAVMVAAIGFATVSAADVGDPERGERLFAQHCLVCHSLQPEHHKEGPSLSGIYSRAAGTQPFYGRYVGLKSTDIVWTEVTLDGWLADPRAFLGGRNTAMTFKLTDAGARADVIAYLKTDP
jgi:cytochrome c